MIRFLGNIEAKLDAKGRVFIPSTFRRRMQEAGETEMVLRKDIHQQCLVLYPESVWFNTQDELRARLSVWNAQEQGLFRRFVSGAEIVSSDSNGRILISKRLLQSVGIASGVVFVGMGETVEIWPCETWGCTATDGDSLGQSIEDKMCGKEALE